MKVDMVYSHDHYRDHMLPIWNVLPRNQHKGDVYRGRAPLSDNILMVAGYSDMKANPGRKFIYVEHGAGQSYVDIDPAVAPFYSGGPQHRNVIGYVCPNAEVAQRWNVAYPNVPTVVVGCPRLDRFHNRSVWDEYNPRTVAITFHWDAQFTGVPETASAFGHYLASLIPFLEQCRHDERTVIGHAHPRYPAVLDFWNQAECKDLGVQVAVRSDELMDRAGILVADNTSLQAEFLSLGRPVVWLNHPGYRKAVHHGGRFWQWPTLSGIQVDTGSELLAVNLDALPPTTGHPYAFADGSASTRAADFVVSLLN